VKYLANDKTVVFSYDPFGMITVGRSWEVGSEYRYGFNGKENSDEFMVMIMQLTSAQGCMMVGWVVG